ncbi:MAG: hypothetical protein WBA54_14170 [Acidaminobacteraceae bacterium]
MNINSVSSYSSFNYGNLSIANSKQDAEDESSVDGVKKGKGGPGGPKGAGGPPPGGGKGPDLDTDTDGLWSKDEVSEYAATSDASFDVDDIFSKYDTDEDGSINASERKSLASDNAFKLSKPQDIAKGMMAGNQRSIPMVSIDEDEDDESSVIEALSESNILDSLNESFISKYIEAYQSSSDYKTQDIASLFDFAM